jgi:hypothetical protein
VHPPDLELVDADVNAPTPEELEADRDLLAAARGVAAVDRAVNHRNRTRSDLTGHVHVPASLATVLGWPTCSSCGGGVAPGRAVHWRGGLLHPECTAAVLLGLAAAA